MAPLPRTAAGRGGVRPRRALGLAAAVVVAALLAPPSALAHPVLVQGAPDAGALVPRPPQQVVLRFSEPVRSAGSRIELRGPHGVRVALGAVRSEGRRGLTADVPSSLAAAVYAVRYTVLGDDGHAIGGEVRFGVARPDGGPPAGAEQLAGAAAAGADAAGGGDAAIVVLGRWLGLLAAGVLLGGALLAGRLGRALPAPWPRVALGAAGLLVVTAAGAALAAAVAGAGGLDLGLLASTPGGVLAVARLAVVAAGLVVALRRRSTVALGATAALALALGGVDGHVLAVDEGRVAAVALGVAHVLAAGLWAGGLLAGLVALAGGVRPRAVVGALAPVAAAATAALALTGVVVALREVDTSAFLQFTAYGRVVLVKSVALLLLVALGAAATLRARGGGGARILRIEALGAGAVLALAALLAGLVPGRGQPSFAERGTLIGGPALGTVATADGSLRVALAPARPGRNAVVVLPGGGARPSSVRATLTCACTAKPVRATLRRQAGGAWKADVDLPAAGRWLATVEGGAPVSLAVVGGEDGPAPLELVQTADLSGRDAARCRSHAQGLALALGRLNAQGGADGRKVLLRTEDDGGSPSRAAALTRAAADRGALALAAPCGAGAGEALASSRLPAVVADPAVPVVARDRVWRLAGDPRSEGRAVGQYLADQGLKARPDAPRRVRVLSAAGASPERLAGLREGVAGSGLEVEALRLGARTRARRVVSAQSSLAVVVDGDPGALARALREVRLEDVPPAVVAASPLFDERFQARAGQLGRLGAIRSPTEVAPDSRDGLAYANAIAGLHRGDRPQISGLRGFVAGLALAEGLRDGEDGLAARLARPRRFTDALVAPWRADAPERGGPLFGFVAPTFLPPTLIPGSAGGERYGGTWFADGAWRRVSGRPYGDDPGLVG